MDPAPPLAIHEDLLTTAPFPVFGALDMSANASDAVTVLNCVYVSFYYFFPKLRTLSWREPRRAKALTFNGEHGRASCERSGEDGVPAGVIIRY